MLSTNFPDISSLTLDTDYFVSFSFLSNEANSTSLYFRGIDIIANPIPGISLQPRVYLVIDYHFANDGSVAYEFIPFSPPIIDVNELTLSFNSEVLGNNVFEVHLECFPNGIVLDSYNSPLPFVNKPFIDGIAFCPEFYGQTLSLADVYSMVFSSEVPNE
jgi:hypothetical protein